MILQNSIGKLDLFKDENYFQEQLLNVSLLKFVVIFYIYIVISSFAVLINNN